MEYVHFGKKVKEHPGNNLNKEFYLSAQPEGLPLWEQRHYVKQKIYADYNYDLNMMFFDSLDKEKFNLYLEKQIKKYKFKECKDLNEVNKVCGVYMIVLDKYKQVYIGQSNNIKRRIYRHWSDFKSLERLTFGPFLESIISIDSFGPLDTTRIYYFETYNTHKIEEKIVSKFNRNYLINRTAGGIGSYHNFTADEEVAKMSVVANRKTRDYSKFVDIEKVKEITGDDFLYFCSKYPFLKDERGKKYDKK